MNLISYIKKYGDFSLEEKKLNEIDYLIFSTLSYLDLDGIVYNKPKLLSSVALEFDIKNKKQEIRTIKSAIKILQAIKDKKRYSKLKLYNYEYIGTQEGQFSALCIKINCNTIFIAFEGTDHLISGWKEDFQMSYMFPVLAQTYAINYLNRVVKFKDKNIIVGGHSKGGNLALVASMYCKFWVKLKIKEIYSFDGIGLRKRELDSIKYKSIEKRFNDIIVDNSIVGALLRHKDNYRVIKSSKKNFYSHNFLTWQIDCDKFVDSELSSNIIKIKSAVISWLDNNDDEQRKKFVNAIFKVLKKAKIYSLKDVKKSIYKNVVSLIKEIKHMDSEEKKIVKNFIKYLFNYSKKYNKNNNE